HVRLSGGRSRSAAPLAGGVGRRGGPQGVRGGGTALVGAPVPETGRYALQGVQLRVGVELWAARTGARLLIEDDRSCPQPALGAGARVVVVTARGPFGRLAREGLQREARSLGVSIAASFSFADGPERIAAIAADAVLACGPFERELELLRALRLRAPQTVLGGVSPGLSAFPARLGQDPEGMIAVAQWHPRLGADPLLGPP